MPGHYARELAKYDDHPSRRRIPHQRVPKLECRRQDVLNFAPAHPHLIYRAWLELGVRLPAAWWFGIPIKRISGQPAVTFYPAAEHRVGSDIPNARVCWFDAASYRELRTLPESTLQWYAHLHLRGQKGAWFAGLPHVLVKGAVSVGGLEHFDWRVPPHK